jgi:hypothetical protein
LNRINEISKLFPSGGGQLQSTDFGQSGQLAAWAGRSGGFDELGMPQTVSEPEEGAGKGFRLAKAGGFDAEGMAPITSQLANANTTQVNGSATVDIDVSKLGEPERNADELFPKESLEGGVQMQNISHQTSDRMTFQ